MPIKLNGATSGSVELDVPDIVNGGDILIDIEPLRNFVGSSLVPAGSIIYTLRNTAPTGFIKANGATLSRTVYADLFAAIGTWYGSGDGSTTFNTPDLRGEFLRVWDDSRGVDSGRNYGTFQAAEVLDHNHTFRYNNGPANADYGNGGNYLTAKSTGLTRISQPGAAGRTGTMINNRGDADGRPRNCALLVCIKY